MSSFLFAVACFGAFGAPFLAWSFIVRWVQRNHGPAQIEAFIRNHPLYDRQDFIR